MNTFKKSAVLCAALILALSTAAFAACKDSENSASTGAGTSSSENIESENSSFTQEEEEVVYLMKGANDIEIPAGKTVNVSFGRVFVTGNNYVLSWTDDNANVVLQNATIISGSAAEKNVEIMYTYTTALTISTKTGETATITLNVGDVQKVIPSITVGEHTASVKTNTPAEYIFTADEAGAYTIATTDTNAKITYTIANYSEDATSTNSATFDWTADTDCYITITTQNEKAGNVTFAITKTGEISGALQSEKPVLVTDSSQPITRVFTATTAGAYGFYTDDTGVTYTDKNGETQTVTPTYTQIILAENESVTFTFTKAEDDLEEKVYKSIHITQLLAVGENVLTLTNGRISLPFIPEETDTYKFECNEGTIFVMIDLEFIEMTDGILEAQAGETYYIIIHAENAETVTVTVDLINTAA